MEHFKPDMNVGKLDTIQGFIPHKYWVYSKALFDMPYDMPYGKKLTDEQSIQFPRCIAAAIHCSLILVY